MYSYNFSFFISLKVYFAFKYLSIDNKGLKFTTYPMDKKMAVHFLRVHLTPGVRDSLSQTSEDI